MNLLKDLLHRLRQSMGWVIALFGGTLLLVLIGIAWTRLPDKHVWQVVLSLLLPLMLLAAALILQAGTMCSLTGDDGKRVKLVWGAATLLVWVALAAATWWMLDWCDDRIPEWAGYLNSKASAHARAKLFTYDHLFLWMTILEWFFRWVVIPAKVIPYAMASAQWGWRLPWRSLLGLLWNWRWWLGILAAALVAVWLPGQFFSGVPHGTVSVQIWSVALKLGAAYLLAISCWVFVLAWAAVLFGRQQSPAMEEPIAVPALVGPPEPDKQDSVKLPLPEGE